MSEISIYLYHRVVEKKVHLCVGVNVCEFGGEGREMIRKKGMSKWKK